MLGLNSQKVWHISPEENMQYVTDRITEQISHWNKVEGSGFWM